MFTERKGPPYLIVIDRKRFEAVLSFEFGTDVSKVETRPNSRNGIGLETTRVLERLQPRNDSGLGTTPASKRLGPWNDSGLGTTPDWHAVDRCQNEYVARVAMYESHRTANEYMSDEADSDLRECISTVVKRTEFLDRLAEEPTSKRDLRDELDLSRSTVYKAVRELEDRGLVTETDAGVALTLVGRLLAEECLTFESRVAAVTDAEALLSALPADVPVTTDLLVGAETVRGERHAPTGPVAYIDEFVRRTDRVVGFTPVVLPQYVDMFHEEVVSGDLIADLVLETPVVEYLRENHGDRLSAALATGNLSVRRTDETLPFGLVVAEDEGVVLIVYDESGDLRGVLMNDTDAALDWGTDLFDTYWDRAGEESG